MNERAAGEFDVAVVGLGVLGSAAAWQLAPRGMRVIGFDRYPLGHAHGASHGDSRIIRLSYHTPSYVRSAAAAFDAWAELEADAGVQLITPAGGADVFPPGAAIHVADYTASMDAAGVDYDVLDQAASSQRWPGLVVPDGSVVLHQERTGIVAAGLSLEVLHRQARAHGAVLHGDRPVNTVREDDDGILLTTADGARHQARTVVIAVDGWTNHLLDAAGLPLVTTQEFVAHFAVPPKTHAPGQFPVWIWMDDPSYYGFPSFGEDTIKIGQDCGGREVDPDLPADHPGRRDPEYVERLTAFVRRTIPAAGPLVRLTGCHYTLTPDRDFVLGALPGHERVLVALGAAHGFKFAAWFGAALADLAQTGSTTVEIADFAVDRPALATPPVPTPRN